MPLVVAGDGPQRAALSERARGARVRFLGHVPDEQLARLRAEAAIALVPSRSAETFGLAAAEAMAAGVPVVGSRVGALPELLDPDALVPPSDAAALAGAIERLAGDRAAGARGAARIRSLCAPDVVAGALKAVYDGPDRPEPRT
jgi:glycosyltransferase involved in cell wall biosynthesis